MEKPEKCDSNVLEYLNYLKSSGTCNMFGAVPYLCSNFSFSKKEAKEILLYWMNTYTDRKEESC